MSIDKERFEFLEKILEYPNNQYLKYIDSEKYFESINKDKFHIYHGILDFFLDDGDEITNIQKDFYEDVKFPNYDNFNDFGTLIDKATKSIFAKKLDEEIPFNSTVLDAGCGTGQMSLFLSRYNRKIFSIDLSINSLKLGEDFRKKNLINNVYFMRMNLFNLLFKKNFFDVIISNGVLHHTSDPKKAFILLIEHLKKDGYIVLGLYHRYGRIFTNIKQFVIKYFGDIFKFLDKKNYDSSIGKNYAWFKDQYKNPKESSHTYKEILNWFYESDIEFISSIPFSFSNNLQDNDLFTKKKLLSNSKIYFEEIFQCFSPSQIKEGGFMIMIGRKL